jgi:hypothetical protein
MADIDTRPPIPASLAGRPVVGGLAVLERLAADSRSEGDCLVWTCGRDHKGYGRVRINGKMMMVHRAAWIARRGLPPPDKPHVLHHCDNPPCWKDGHLWVGTDADNAADRDSKGRNGYSKITHCPQNHLYDEANTYLTKDGKRMCRKCLRARDRRYKALKKSTRDWSICTAGHSLSGDNLYVDRSGTKRCRTCISEQDKRRRAERKRNKPDSVTMQRRKAFAAAFDNNATGWLTPPDLKEASQLSKAGVHKLLNRLMAQEVIIKMCHGRYRAAPGKLVRDAIQ